jgi:hypothetical protein
MEYLNVIFILALAVYVITRCRKMERQTERNNALLLTVVHRTEEITEKLWNGGKWK